MDRTTTRTRRPRSKPAAEKARAAAAPNTGRLASDLAAISLCLVGVLLALGLYRPGSAGWVGATLVQMIRFWMGHVVYVAPLLFVAAGIVLAMHYQRAANTQAVLGAAGLLVMLFGVVHLMSTPHGAAFDSTAARWSTAFGKHPDPALLGRPDAGLFGATVMTLLFPLGVMGAYCTLGAIGLASVILISDLTLRGMAERIDERSRIARERAKKSVTAVRERYQEAAEARRERRQQQLFLDVGEDEEEEEEEAPKPLPAAKRKPARAALARTNAAEAAPEPPALPAKTATLDLEPPDLEVPDFMLMPPEEVLPVRKSEPAPAPAAVARARRPVRPARKGEGVDAEDYVLPPVDLLESAPARVKRTPQDNDQNIAILENTLAQFRIQAQVVEIADGPSITRYEIRLGEGIRVRKILDLADNIAMSLSAMSVRVEAPIPGKAAIGIEVPKKHPAVVTLRECLEAPEFADLKSRVGFVLGKDVAGEVRCADLARMPHLLVAGATNSGKSVCLNVLIASMLFRSRPDELKMIMIDPKRVELTLYDGIPHLIHPVVKDVKQAAGILRWVLKEMDRRYDLFAQVMTRNIENYNEKMSKEPEKRLPFLVVVIDELADLMMQQGPEIEQSICRLAQLARATGIHLVIATQRPSVDVITGLIKANVPSRIAFAVSSQIDSRTIMDTKGAENLIGRGDMLFKPVDAQKPVRIQGAFLKESEVEHLVNHLKTQGRPEYIAESLNVDHGAYGQASEEEADDELFEPAARFVVTTGHASTSMIQRRFKIGYTRAARLVDMMEARGIVGALDGAKPREILMGRDGIDQMFLSVRNSLYGGTDYGPADEPEEEEEAEPEGDEPGAAARDPFLDD